MFNKQSKGKLESTHINLGVEADHPVDQLFINNGKSAVVNLILTLFVVVFEQYYFDDISMVEYYWFLVFILLIILRIFLVFSRNPLNLKNWKLLFTFYVIATGLTWGCSLYVFSPQTPSEFIFISLITLAVQSGAATTMTIRMRDYVIFIISLSIPFSIYLFTSEYSLKLGPAYLTYCLICLFFAKNIVQLQKAATKNLDNNIHLINRIYAEKEKAEAANLEKTRFIANASHDLRQPLHALGLYLDSLDNDKIASEKKSEILKKSKNSLRSLDELFTSLLEISNIDAGAISVSPVHLRVKQLLVELNDQIKLYSEAKKIKTVINTDDSHVAFCDPTLFIRCVRNIMLNAIHHSEGSVITLTSKELEDSIEISVSDNGKGIAKENLGVIFKEFSQLDNPNRDRRKGLGLGLAIVKGLLDLQGHKISVESELNQGTTFFISIPYGDRKYISSINNNTKQLKKLNFKKKILVIDDEHAILDSMNILLQSWEQTVVTADSVAEAIKVIDKGFSPDIVISDYRLQNNTTGVDAVTAIKGKLKESVEIIFISGDTAPKKINEIRAFGYPLIHKPVNPVNLSLILIRLHQKSHQIENSNNHSL